MFTAPYVATSSHADSAVLTPERCPRRLTAILVSRFLSNLQEANLRSFKVDSDNPLYISSVSAKTSRLSFVAAPRAAGSVGGSSVMDAHDATSAAEDGDIRCVEGASYRSTEEELLDMEAATH